MNKRVYKRNKKNNKQTNKFETEANIKDTEEKVGKEVRGVKQRDKGDRARI